MPSDKSETRARPEKKELNWKVKFFEKLLPFQVTIINNTGHILRMRDSRVAYIEPGSDEPLMALDKATILEDMEILPVYDQLIWMLNHYQHEIINDLDECVEKGLRKVIKKIKFINAFNREIMPDMKFTGIVVFPIDPAEASEGKVSFIDMVSKTDNAGNPADEVERTVNVVDTTPPVISLT